jgi:WhiB family transcriptional regulator, redox-sensing transcriptional regulator
VTAAAGLDVAGWDRRALTEAVRVAARAVRVGARVRMPVLGSVQHGTPAAAVRGCPCRRCERLRDRLLAPAVSLDPGDGRVPTTTGGAPPLQPRLRSSAASAPRRVIEADPVAVERACACELPAGRLTIRERTAAVSRLTRSGLSARQVSARIGVSPRTVVRARQRSREHGHRSGQEAVPELLGWAAGGSEAWRDEALCRQVDPELFFPEKGGAVREAKRVCAGCPVREQCLAWAITHDQRYGVWGGLIVAERMQLRRQRETERAG